MKKVFLLSCLFLSTLLSVAQTKKVAILETVDREGKISYANKLILRSNLAKAITNTPGYEAYDRTDMDAILGEQNFQRTGMVSNEQIKKLGEMTGAKFVMVAEAVYVDANTMYITAKLLDVETARTEATDNQMMGIAPREIQRGCLLLAEKLVKPDNSVAVSKANTPSKSKETTTIPAGGLITKISNNEYRLNGTKMDKKAYENFIYTNCPEAWKKHQSAKHTIAAGWTFFASGIALTSMWGLLGIKEDYSYSVGYYDYYYDYYDYDYYYDSRTPEGIETAAIVLGSIGACLTAISIPLLAGGYAVKGNTYKTYNKKCASASATPVTLNLKASSNGLGLAVHF